MILNPHQSEGDKLIIDIWKKNDWHFEKKISWKNLLYMMFHI